MAGFCSCTPNWNIIQNVQPAQDSTHAHQTQKDSSDEEGIVPCRLIPTPVAVDWAWSADISQMVSYNRSVC